VTPISPLLCVSVIPCTTIVQSQLRLQVEDDDESLRTTSDALALLRANAKPT
jgi:hypothetical protein